MWKKYLSEYSMNSLYSNFNQNAHSYLKPHEHNIYTLYFHQNYDLLNSNQNWLLICAHSILRPQHLTFKKLLHFPPANSSLCIKRTHSIGFLNTYSGQVLWQEPFVCWKGREHSGCLIQGTQDSRMNV